MSPQLSSTAFEIDTQWCLDDACKAHDILDAIENAESIARAKAEASRG